MKTFFESGVEENPDLLWFTSVQQHSDWSEKNSTIFPANQMEAVVTWPFKLSPALNDY